MLNKIIFEYCHKFNRQAYWLGRKDNCRLGGNIVTHNYSLEILKLKNENITDIVILPKNHLFNRLVNNKSKLKNSMFFFSELLQLLENGHQCVKAIGIIANIDKGPEFNYIIINIANAINNGSSLNEALRLYPEFFSSINITTIAIGEKTAKLNTCLRQIIAQQELLQQTRIDIINACRYPAILLISALAMLLFFFNQVIPSFANLINDLAIEAPTQTKNLITIATFINYYAKDISQNIIILFIFLLLKPYKKQRNIYNYKTYSNLGLMKKLQQQYFTTRFSYNIAMLIKSGVDIISALSILANDYQQKQSDILYIKNKLICGNNFYNSIKNSKLITNTAKEQIYIAEQSNNLVNTLEKIAKQHTKKTQDDINRYCKLLEPLLILLTGLVIGSILFNIYIPILQMPNML